jgi:hypothetical protein
MKTLKSMLAVIALLFVGAAANATTKTVGGNPTKDDVLNVYISAISTGSIKGLDKILDNDLQFNTQAGANVNTLNKDELLSYLKNNAVANQPLSVASTVLDEDDNTAKVKIDFKYDGYVRTDVVTLNKSFGWVITNVNSSTH